MPSDTEFVPVSGLTQSWIASMSATVTIAESESVIISVSKQFESRMMETIIRNSFTETLTVILSMGETFVPISFVTVVIVQLPQWVTVSKLAVFRIRPPTELELSQGVTAGVLIGSVSGGALAVVLLAGAIMFVVKKRGGDVVSSEDGGAPTAVPESSADDGDEPPTNTVFDDGIDQLQNMFAPETQIGSIDILKESEEDNANIWL
jgi:hypothetical protein